MMYRTIVTAVLYVFILFVIYTLTDSSTSSTVCTVPQNPCKFGGLCTVVDGGYECDCRPGYEGINCTVVTGTYVCHYNIIIRSSDVILT